MNNSFLCLFTPYVYSRLLIAFSFSLFLSFSLSLFPSCWNFIKISCVLYVFAALSLHIRNLHSTYASVPQHYENKWLGASFAIGCVLFFVHTFCGDPSTLLRWCSQPIPHSQPSVPVSSLLVCVAFAAGLVLSVHLLVGSVVWWLMGTASLFTFYYLDHSAAFYFGLAAVAFYSSLFHALLDIAPTLPPAQAFSVAMFIYVALMFTSVWTVAYNFVPYGDLLRERSWVFLTIITLGSFLSLGVLRPRLHVMKHYSHRTNRKVFFLILLASIGTIVRIWPTHFSTRWDTISHGTNGFLEQGIAGDLDSSVVQDGCTARESDGSCRERSDGGGTEMLSNMIDGRPLFTRRVVERTQMKVE